MQREYGDVEIYRRLLRMARPHWPSIFAIFLLGLLATPVGLVTPLPLKIAVDNVIGDEPAPSWLGFLPDSVTDSKDGLLVVVAVMVILIALATQLIALGTAVLEAHTGEQLKFRFRTALFRHVQRLSLGYHDHRGSSDSIYRIQYDAPAIQWIAVNGVTPFFSSALMLIGMFAVTAAIDLELALVALIVSPILVALTVFFRRRLRWGWDRERDIDSSAMAVIQEVLGGLRLVKAFGQEDREHSRYVERSEEGTNTRIRLAVMDGVFSLLIGLTIAVGTAVVLYVGIGHVESGIITLGSFLVVMAYLAQLYQPLNLIAHSVTTLQSSLASAGRSLFVLDQEPDVTDPDDPIPTWPVRGGITFSAVSFGYEPGRPVLRDVDFSIEPGTRLGIAGHTGSGKSTLVGLMMRFHDPQSGVVRLDGHDIRAMRVADLRAQFAIVPQDTVLVSSTIAENIAYGRPGSTLEEIIAAARAAEIHDVITALPDGYQTSVGERGLTMSGGERQRISLARAFLKDAPILILDEPTSAVDPKTEAAMIEAMGRLMVGRTVIMIAHRLSTLEGCDAFLQLSDGRVVATTPPAGVTGAPRAATAAPSEVRRT